MKMEKSGVPGSVMSQDGSIRLGHFCERSRCRDQELADARKSILGQQPQGAETERASRFNFQRLFALL